MSKVSQHASRGTGVPPVKTNHGQDAHATRDYARKLHDELILIDGHNDHMMLKYDRGEPFRLMTASRRYHSDGARLLRGGMTATMFMVGGHELAPSLAIIEQAHREIAASPDSLLLVTRADDIVRAKRSGKLGVLLSWESLMALGEKIDLLGAAHRLGIRVSTLTHGEGQAKRAPKNILGGGGKPLALQGTASAFSYCTPGERAAYRKRSKGLTAFGRQVIPQMNRLGMLIDLAHANDATVDDVLELTSRPVVSTHGGVYACCPHYRCSTDEQIRGIAAAGGLVSIAFYDKFIAQPPAAGNVDGIVRHIEHVAGLVGIEHVAIGSDYDGLGDGIWPVVRTADRLRELTEAMVRAGLSDADIGKVWGGNWLRVLKATIG